MATVIINGVTIQTDGDNVNIVSRNGQISVNGNVAGTNFGLRFLHPHQVLSGQEAD